MNLDKVIIPVAYANALERLVRDTEEYKLWKNHFDYMHGGEANIKKSSKESIFEIYNVQSSERDISLLIFCIESVLGVFLELKTEVCLQKITNNSKTLDVGSNFLLGECTQMKLGLRGWLYSWLLDVPEVKEKLEKRISELGDNSDWVDLKNGDHCQNLYHDLFVKEIRHSIGAYFTPDWLAKDIINDLLPKFKKDSTLLEPTCGSGVFSLALYDVLKKDGWSGEELLVLFTENISFFELNPISIISARLNWLRIIYDITKSFEITVDTNIKCPVYFKDCMVVETDDSQSQELSSNNLISRIGQSYLLNNLNSEVSEHCKLFKNSYLKTLESSLEFDFIVGNPPWINWENLNSDFREVFSTQWPALGLFGQKGTNKSFSKEDISTFILYFCAKHYLKNNGSLSFVMPQSIFKSAKNSKGFRNFFIGDIKTPLSVNQVIDYSNVTVFKSASTRASVICLTKNLATQYPVKYFRAKKQTDRLLSNSGTFDYEELYAKPIDPDDSTSIWMTYPKDYEDTLNRLQGVSAYRARAGMFTGGANAVFYVEIIQDLGKTYLVRNLTERAKVKVDEVEFEIEKEVVFPFSRGRDVDFWNYDHSGKRAVIFPHTEKTKMAPIEESIFSEQYPLAYDYLRKNKELLLNRGGLTKLDSNSLDKGFYTLLRIGEYTFNEYKVAWKYISKEFTCCILEPQNLEGDVSKPLIPQEKLMIIPVKNQIEAYFLCGYLSSKQMKIAVESRMVSTQISAHVINQLNIPRFDDSLKAHIDIAEACRRGYQKEITKEESINLISNLVKTII